MIGRTAMSNPGYPIYIISKGRWESRLTVKALERMQIPYSLVIEPQEYDQYAAVVDPKKIMVTPFSNLGQGSIPVRNYVWDHATTIGAYRHWIVDDNIRVFYRLNHNKRQYCLSGSIFKAAEDFVDRYENVAVAGMQYVMFAPDRAKVPPFYLNTRIYSCILLRNDLPYRWRGRYNEDTDLSIRMLKDGWCSVLFNAFLAQKIATMTMKGGNTEALYQDDGRLKMAESLRDQHPDITQIIWKWGRWQHQVDYRGFKRNQLIRKPGLEIPQGINEYGMVLKPVPASIWEDLPPDEPTDEVLDAI